MLQNLTKGKMVEWVVLLVALVALGLSIAAVVKPCSSNFGDTWIQDPYSSDKCEYIGDDCTDMLSEPVEARMNCKCNPDSGPPPCKPKGHDCQNNKECCNNIKCKNNVCGDCAGNDEACPTDDNPDRGRSCCNPLKCLRGTCQNPTSKPSYDKIIPGLTKSVCKAKGHFWSEQNQECLDHKLPSGKKGTIGGDPGSLGPDLGNIGGHDGEYHGPSLSHSPSPGPSPSHGPGGGKKSSDLPLILGISGGVGVLLIILAYLIATNRLKL